MNLSLVIWYCLRLILGLQIKLEPWACLHYLSNTSNLTKWISNDLSVLKVFFWQNKILIVFLDADFYEFLQNKFSLATDHLKV